MLKNLTAVIPTFTNDVGLTKLVEQLARTKIGMVIVDNCPNEVKKKLADAYKAVYLPQKINMGFAKAVNLGIHKAKTEWVLIVNDDVEVETNDTQQMGKHAVAQLRDEAVKRGWVAVSPVLIKPDQMIENVGYQVLPIGKVVLNFDTVKCSDKDLDGLTAACLLIKRHVFTELGGFDESFFAYLEDVDLFLRIKEKGYAFGVAADVFVIHHHQQTSQKNPKRKAYLDMVNWWRVVLKHPHRFIFSPTLPLMLVERIRNVSGLVKAQAYTS